MVDEVVVIGGTETVLVEVVVKKEVTERDGEMEVVVTEFKLA